MKVRIVVAVAMLGSPAVLALIYGLKVSAMLAGFCFDKHCFLLIFGVKKEALPPSKGLLQHKIFI